MSRSGNEVGKAFATEIISGLSKITEALEAEFQAFGMFESKNTPTNQTLLEEFQLEQDKELIFRDLIVFGIIWRDKLEKAGDTGNARLELTRVIEAASSLIQALESLKFVSIIALGGGDIDLDGANSIASKWTTTLSELIDKSKEALNSIGTARGRPRKKIPQLIAYDLCRYHYYFKGEWPNMSINNHSFSDFLNRIYKILGLGADAMGQLKVAKKRIREEYPHLK